MLSCNDKAAVSDVAKPFLTQSILPTGADMNLTAQQVTKATGLALQTVYGYSSRLKLGKKVGRTKVYTNADVQKILRKARKSPPTRKTKPPLKKGIKKASKRAVSYASKPVAVTPTTKAPSPTVKPSVWRRFLFGKNKIK